MANRAREVDSDNFESFFQNGNRIALAPRTQPRIIDSNSSGNVFDLLRCLDINEYGRIEIDVMRVLNELKDEYRKDDMVKISIKKHLKELLNSLYKRKIMEWRRRGEKSYNVCAKSKRNGNS